MARAGRCDPRALWRGRCRTGASTARARPARWRAERGWRSVARRSLQRSRSSSAASAAALAAGSRAVQSPAAPQQATHVANDGFTAYTSGSDRGLQALRRRSTPSGRSARHRCRTSRAMVVEAGRLPAARAQSRRRRVEACRRTAAAGPDRRSRVLHVRERLGRTLHALLRQDPGAGNGAALQQQRGQARQRSTGRATTSPMSSAAGATANSCTMLRSQRTSNSKRQRRRRAGASLAQSAPIPDPRADYTACCRASFPSARRVPCRHVAAARYGSSPADRQRRPSSACLCP